MEMTNESTDRLLEKFFKLSTKKQWAVLLSLPFIVCSSSIIRFGFDMATLSFEKENVARFACDALMIMVSTVAAITLFIIVLLVEEKIIREPSTSNQTIDIGPPNGEGDCPESSDEIFDELLEFSWADNYNSDKVS